MKTDYLRNKELDQSYRGQPWTPPASYLGALTCSRGQRTSVTSYALNDTIVLVPAGKTRLQLYKVTTAGTTAASQPGAFLGVAGEVVTDGTAVLTEQSTALLASTSGIPAAAVEPIGGSYARAALVQTLAGMTGTQGVAGSASSGNSGTISNVAAIVFAVPTGNWAIAPGGIWAFGRFDALSGGNLMELLPDVVVRSVASGDQAMTIASGALNFSAT